MSERRASEQEAQEAMASMAQSTLESLRHIFVHAPGNRTWAEVGAGLAQGKPPRGICNLSQGALERTYGGPRGGRGGGIRAAPRNPSPPCAPGARRYPGTGRAWARPGSWAMPFAPSGSGRGTWGRPLAFTRAGISYPWKLAWADAS